MRKEYLSTAQKLETRSNLTAASQEIAGIREALQRETDAARAPERCRSLIAVLHRIGEITPSALYAGYGEFFAQTAGFAAQCGEAQFYRDNREMLLSTIALCEECVGELCARFDAQMIKCPCCSYESYAEEPASHSCPVCGADERDRRMVTILAQRGIIEAEEGTRVAVSGMSEALRLWLNTYAPQLDLIEESADQSSWDIRIDREAGVAVTRSGDERLAADPVIDRALCENGPLVSVLLPCYNHAPYVAAAIESVIHQSYQNVEFIIADDGSVDGTQEIMRRYEEHYAWSYYSERNTGNLFWRMKEEAHGKYIAIMHSDDVWEPDKLALQVAWLESHSECGCCVTWAGFVDEHDQPLSSRLFIQKNRSRGEWIRYFWQNGNALCNPSCVAKRELFLKWYTPGTRIGYISRQLPDLFKWVDTVQETELHVVTRLLTRMHLHGGKDTNVSAPNSRNDQRARVERSILWPVTLKKMEDPLFAEAFRPVFIRPDAAGEKELKCERFFLLLHHPDPLMQQSALSYFAEIYWEVYEVLASKYRYTLGNYHQDECDLGVVSQLAPL